MKKLTAILLVIVSLLSLSACKFNLQTKTPATREVLTQYAKDKLGEDLTTEQTDLCFTFEMTERSEAEDYDGRMRGKLNLSAKCFVSKDGNVRISYKSKDKTTYLTYLADRSIRSSYLLKENGVYLFTAETEKTEFFVDVLERGKNHNGNYAAEESSFSRKLKTTQEEESRRLATVTAALASYYSFFTKLVSVATGFSGAYGFIDGESITIIESSSSSHVVYVALFEGKTLKALKITSTSTSYASRKVTEKVYEFGKDFKDEINAPKDADEYKA